MRGILPKLTGICLIKAGKCLNRYVGASPIDVTEFAQNIIINIGIIAFVLS